MATTNKKDILDPATASIISIIMFMIVGENTSPQGNKLDLLEHWLKKSEDLYGKSYYNFRTKKVLKLIRGSYANWKARLFRKESKYPEIGVVRKRCEVIAKQSSKAFTDFKAEVVKWLEEDGCMNNEPIAYTCAITSLVVMANTYCGMAIKRAEINPLMGAEVRTMEIIIDEQFVRNCKQMFPLVFTPNDINVNDSPEIVEATNRLVDRVWELYCKNFY